MIPLFHDLTDERVVIFGGGAVAARKAARFGSEATVIVASVTFHDRFEELSAQLVRTEIGDGLVESLSADAFLVIPATDDETLNRRIERIARSQSCLVNPVDHRGKTVTPSTIEGENVHIAIATGGRSPAVSKYLRQRLEAEVQRADAMVDLQADLREELGDLSETDRRDRLWQVLEDDQVWDAIESGELEHAASLARENL